ncbi:RNA polymerase sigma factor [Pedobacter sp. PWIIR3]
MSDYKNHSDQELLALLREGQHSAFAEIYNRFYSLLYVHAYRRLNDEDAANDLMQDVFVGLWERRDQLVLKGSLSSYLYAVVRNRIIDLFSHSKVSEKYLSSLGAYFEQDKYEADFKVRESQLRTLIEKEIAALPEAERQIFTMSRMEDMSYREIAEKLDMTEEAVKSKMKRTLKVLRGRLGLWAYLLMLLKLF